MQDTRSLTMSEKAFRIREYKSERELGLVDADAVPLVSALNDILGCVVTQCCVGHKGSEVGMQRGIHWDEDSGYVSLRLSLALSVRMRCGGIMSLLQMTVVDSVLTAWELDPNDFKGIRPRLVVSFKRGEMGAVVDEIVRIFSGRDIGEL